MTCFSVSGSGTREIYTGSVEKADCECNQNFNRTKGLRCYPVSRYLEFANHVQHTFCGNPIHTEDA